MTDIVSTPPAVAPGWSRSEVAARQLQRRHRADRRLRLYGIAAIVIALGLLVILLTSIFVASWTAWTQTQVRIEVTLDLNPIQRDNFSWSINTQYSRNRSCVKELAGAEHVDSINVALVDPDSAADVARELNTRTPGVVARPAEGAAGLGSTFVVLERFHFAIAAVTIVAATVFLLALTIMLVDERR